MLTYDVALRRTYRNSVGQEVHVWIIFWSTPSAIRGYHHPEVCWPNRGWTVTRKATAPIDLGDGCQLSAMVRYFKRGAERQRVAGLTLLLILPFGDGAEKASRPPCSSRARRRGGGRLAGLRGPA